MIADMTSRLGHLRQALTPWKGPIWATICGLLLAAVVIGLVALDRYRAAAIGPKTGPVVLVDIPAWADQSPQLMDKIVKALGGTRLALVEDLPRRLVKSLSGTAWLDQVQVWLTPGQVNIKAHWRRPAAAIQIGQSTFYVDRDQVVLDYLSIKGLDVKWVRGLSLPDPPVVGQVLACEDLGQALELLGLLESMDATATPARPLTQEIEAVDVGNYKGRRDPKQPHLVLYAKDGTQIIWGAELGQWGRYLEANDQEKLARLYSFYKESGTLMGLVKYIDLRSAQYRLPAPIDQYPIVAP